MTRSAGAGASREGALDRPLRIAIGLAGLAFGGAQINAIDLARTLRERGHDVVVFGVRDDEVRNSILSYASLWGFEVELVDAGPLPRIARGITAVAEEHRADVVHVFAPWLGRVGAVASARWGERALVETNWNMENAFWGSPRVPLIVGTGAMQQEAERRIDAPVYLMEPPVDLAADKPDERAGRSFRADYGIGDDELLITVVTRVDTQMKSEGLRQAIAAVERLQARPIRLAIVGDGDAFEAISAEAEALAARVGRPAVVMTGSLQDPRGAYAAADVVLGMGGSAIRGLAHGKALIVLGEGGFAMPYEPSTVAHFRREGFYGTSSEGDPVATLAEHIRSLHDDPARRRELAEFSLTEARTRFGLDAATDALEVIYRASVDAPPTRGARRADAARLRATASVQRLRARIRGGVRR